MKNLFRILFATLLLTVVFATSCEKTTDDPPVEENKNFATLKAYLTANAMDVPDILNGWITTAENVYNTNNDADSTNDFYVVDIRSSADFNTGHIAGAVNSTLADILTTAANSNEHTIIVVCKTGQTASHAVVALRLSGYSDAKVMKWGMSGWTTANGNNHWTGNVGDAAPTSGNWEAAPGNLATLVNYGDPVLEATTTDGAGILKERVEKLLAAGFQVISNADVLANPDDYFINNYWATADVEHYGHIKGATRILPLSLAGGEYQYYDHSRTAVTYCWTGQTSSMVTAYMYVIGYKAKSLAFGANGLIYSDLQSHKWNASLSKNYPLSTK
jgi:rhodanese-related sulfurtransferase